MLGLLLFAAAAQAQTVRVTGRFLSDSLKIGLPTAFVLTARYPENVTVLFPDSAFAFAPFEFSKLTYFPTRTTGGESLDSVVYNITSFEIDDVQYLQLPVFLVNARDCTVWTSARDSIFLDELVHQVPDSVQASALPLRVNTSYQLVNKLLNYPLLVVVVVVIAIIGITAALVFGKQIRRYFTRRHLMKRHARFLATFQAELENLEHHFSAQAAEACLVVWKIYMEQLLQFPVTKSTSREIVNQLADQALKPALTDIDRMIYARSGAWKRTPFDVLREHGQRAFERKLEELTYG